MPRYDYHCDANGQTIEVVHSISERLTTWVELCRRSATEVGDTDPSAPVAKVFMVPPMANLPAGDAHLKGLGFTKLVKRDDGVYENVTRSGTEARYMKAGDSSSMPHFHKKMSD
mgnify:CR=1 FL=1|jgi:hypothetical protein